MANCKRVTGSDGTYLNMSSRGWPELTNKAREPSESQSGFVSVVNDGMDLTELNIARGSGCCGRSIPDGSEAPARRWTGRDCATSRRKEFTTLVG